MLLDVAGGLISSGKYFSRWQLLCALSTKHRLLVGSSPLEWFSKLQIPNFCLTAQGLQAEIFHGLLEAPHVNLEGVPSPTKQLQLLRDSCRPIHFEGSRDEQKFESLPLLSLSITIAFCLKLKLAGRCSFHTACRLLASRLLGSYHTYRHIVCPALVLRLHQDQQSAGFRPNELTSSKASLLHLKVCNPWRQP